MRRASCSARWVLALVVALVVIALGGCDWPQTGGGVNRTGFAAFETAITTQTVSSLRLRWSQPLPNSVAVSSPVVSGGKVYVDSTGSAQFLSTPATTSAFDADRGDCTVEHDRQRTHPWAPDPRSRGGVLFTSHGGSQLEARDVSSGAVRWVVDSGALTGAPTPVGAHVFVHTSNGELRAYDIGTGTLSWSAHAPLSMTPPTVANGLVLVSTSGQMRAYDEQTGAYRWTATLPGGGGEAAVTDRIALSTGGSGIGVYDATSGYRWWWHNRVSLATKPSTAYGVVYAVQANAGADTRLYAFDVGTGATRWSAPIHGSTSSQPAIAGGVVFVGSGDGNVYGFDAQTGAELWSAPSGAPIDTSPAIASGEVFVTTTAMATRRLQPSTGGGPARGVAVVSFVVRLHQHRRHVRRRGLHRHQPGPGDQPDRHRIDRRCRAIRIRTHRRLVHRSRPRRRCVVRGDGCVHPDPHRRTEREPRTFVPGQRGRRRSVLSGTAVTGPAVKISPENVTPATGVCRQRNPHHLHRDRARVRGFGSALGHARAPHPQPPRSRSRATAAAVSRSHTEPPARSSSRSPRPRRIACPRLSTSSGPLQSSPRAERRRSASTRLTFGKVPIGTHACNGRPRSRISRRHRSGH